MTAGGALPLLDERIQRVREFVDGLILDPPPTRLELKRRVAARLGLEPEPETLQALAAAAELNDPADREIGLRSAADHLVLTMSVLEAWETPPADTARLAAVAESLPSVLLAHREAREEIRRTLATIGRPYRERVESIDRAFELPDEPVLAAVVVVPEVGRLARAARDGSLAEAAPSLSAEEIAMLTAACVAADDAPPARAIVDAVALRTLIESHLATWREVEATTHPEDDAETRAALRARLERVRCAHPVVSRRLDEVRSWNWERTRRPGECLDETRRRLFAAYLELSKAIRGVPPETTGELQERILEAERAGAAIDAQRRTEEEALRDAQADASRPAGPAVPASAGTRERERRRRRLLVAVAGALVPVAIGSNLAHRLRKPSYVSPTTGMFAEAMPVQQVVPLGGSLYAKVSAFLWNEWNDAQRLRKVEQLGALARSRGFESLVLVDDDEVERARWTARRGAEIRHSAPAGVTE